MLSMMATDGKEDLIHELLEQSRQRLRSGVQGLKQKLWNKSQRVVLSSQLWLHAAPTPHCDVLITLPPRDPGAEFVVTWLVQKIKEKEPRLILELRYHSCVDSYGLYLTARYDTFLRGAELLNLKKRLKPEWGGGYREFVYDEHDCYENVENKGQFLTSQERASILLNLLQSVRAGSNDTLAGISFREGQCIVPVLWNAGLISQILPLHNSDQLKRLRDKWLKETWSPQPLDAICDYFGEKIGMYFAWLSHYTKSLCAPAFFGLVFWLFLMGDHQLSQDVCYVAFALFNIVWASIYLEWWKRVQAEYAYRWGTLGMESEFLAEPRPLHRGDLHISPITGRLEPYYPDWKRRMIRYFFSFPVTFLCLLLFFFVMLFIFQVQEVTDKYFYESTIVLNWIVFVPKLSLAVAIFVAAELYSKFALWLNDLENYRTDDEYENHLINKTVLFQLISSFLPLFYIAFYIQDMDRLRVQLAALLITRQVIGNVQEAVVPYVIEKYKLSRLAYRMTRTMSDKTLEKHVQAAKETKILTKTDSVEEVAGVDQRSDSPASSMNTVIQRRKSKNSDRLALPEFKVSGSQLCQAEVESLLPKYTSPLDDYLEMFIQFGYVVLFSPVFPLAPLFCLINNVLEIKVDAFKLCDTMQRPFGKRVQNIGAWQTCMELMGVLAVIVNCILIAQSGLVKRFWPDLSLSGHIIIVVVVEVIFHIVRLSDSTVLKRQYNAEPFFCFHHANAYEKQDCLVIDLITYPKADPVFSFQLENLRKNGLIGNPNNFGALKRFVLPLVVPPNAKIGDDLLNGKPFIGSTAILKADQSVSCIGYDLSHGKYTEFPRINYDYNGLPYRYCYACGRSDINAFVFNEVYLIDRWE
uniref:Anoctamin n=1 Tax=Romanomermis culicivorax TaxID=13658 RepID=A0A915I863_ROMCU